MNEFLKNPFREIKDEEWMLKHPTHKYPHDVQKAAKWMALQQMLNPVERVISAFVDPLDYVHKKEEQ